MNPRLRILLVEDSADDAFLLDRALTRGGIQAEITRVETPESLAGKLESGEWDVVIADYNLECGYNGISAMEQVRRFSTEIPFILISGSIGEETAVACMKAGANDYVLKNNLARLVPVIERELREMAVRKQTTLTEAAMRLNEERLRTVFRASPVAILICDPESGKTLDANDAFHELVGVPSAEEPQDRPQFLTLEEFNGIRQELAASGSIRNREINFSSRSGETVAAILSAELINLPRQSHILMLLQDITSRKSNEARLQESRERYRHLIENSNDLVFEISQDLRVLYASPNTEQLLGCAPLDVLGRCLLSIIHPEDVQDAETRLSQPRITGLWRYWHTDGTWRWFEASGRSFQGSSDQVRAVIVSRDVTERQRIELAIHAVAKGTAAEVNDHFFRTLVRELSAALNSRFAMVAEQHADKKAFFTVFASCDQGQVLPEMQIPIEGSPLEPVLEGERVCIARNLSAVWPALRQHLGHDADSLIAVPIHISEDSLKGFLAILHDHPMEASPLTGSVMAIFAARASAELARVRGEAEKRKLQGQLFLAQKMEAIGTMAGGIAHDFNNILSAIIVFTELACMDVSNRATVLEHLDQVLKAGNRAKELVKQILAFSRRQQEERQPILLQPIVKEALKLLRSTLPATIDIHQEIDPETPSVLADPSQVHQVLMNLATNAEHAMRGRVGKLSVKLDAVQFGEDSPGKNAELQPGSYARLRVSDEGHGMAQEVIERIFDPFFTTKAAGEGTGLGLAMVHTIMTNHKGAINVTSTPGVGTTFELFFQAREGRAEDVELSVELPRSIYHEHILVVDDEPAIAEGSRRILERLGYRVTWQTDPYRALALFELQQDAFDLVLTDLTMPAMTGIDLAARMLRRRPNLPIILSTGYGQEAALKRARQIGVREVLMKPAEALELATAVARSLPTGGNGSQAGGEI